MVDDVELPEDDFEDTQDAPEEDTQDAPEEDTQDAPEEDTQDAPEEDTQGVAPQPRRAENRVAKLARERNEANAKLAEANTQLAAAKAVAEERTRVAQSSQAQEAAQRAEQERLALMDPVERKLYEADRKIQQLEQTSILSQLKMEDALDKSAYLSNPDLRYKKHFDEVERRLALSRQNGINYKREDILDKILGEQLRKAKPDAKAQAAARQRVNSTRAVPTTGRSNVVAPRSGKGSMSVEDFERAYGDMTI